MKHEIIQHIGADPATEILDIATTPLSMPRERIVFVGAMDIDLTCGAFDYSHLSGVEFPEIQAEAPGHRVSTPTIYAIYAASPKTWQRNHRTSHPMAQQPSFAMSEKAWTGVTSCHPCDRPQENPMPIGSSTS